MHRLNPKSGLSPKPAPKSHSGDEGIGSADGACFVLIDEIEKLNWNLTLYISVWFQMAYGQIQI